QHKHAPTIATRGESEDMTISKEGSNEGGGTPRARRRRHTDRMKAVFGDACSYRLGYPLLGMPAGRISSTRMPLISRCPAREHHAAMAALTFLLFPQAHHVGRCLPATYRTNSLGLFNAVVGDRTAEGRARSTLAIPASQARPPVPCARCSGR